MNRDLSQCLVNELIECLAHRKHDENHDDVDDGYCRLRYAQALLPYRAEEKMGAREMSGNFIHLKQESFKNRASADARKQ